MSVVFVIPGPLRELAGNHDEVRIEATPASVSDALALLWSDWPGLRDRVITERGEVRPHINIFVDGESIRYAEGLRTAVHDGTEVVILPALSGG
jgi:molybdopterin synthase sulfur carrier subunit